MRNRSISRLFGSITVAGGCALAAAAVEIPESVSGCTNLATCAQSVRNDLSRTLKSCVPAGDMATIGRIVDRLSKEGVTAQTYPLWQDAANAIVDIGLAQKKRKPEERQAVMAGFREGGSTFGLWQGSDEVVKVSDQMFVDAAVNVLTRKLPHGKLAADLDLRRLQLVLSLQDRAGTLPGQIAAAESIRRFAFALKPVTATETNVVVWAADAYGRWLMVRGKNAAYAEFAHAFRTQRADFATGAAAKRWMACELAGYVRAGDDRGFAALNAEFAKLPVDGELFAAVRTLADFANWRVARPRWEKVAEAARPLLSHRSAFTGLERMRLDEFSLVLAGNLGDSDAMKRDYAAIVATADAIEKRQKNENARVVDSARRTFVERMKAAGDYAAALPEMEKGLDARNPNGYWDLACVCVRCGRNDRALELCEALLGTNLSARAETKADAQSLKAWLQAKDAKDLVARLNAGRGETDDKAWFNALRRASRLYYTLDPSERRLAWLKAVVAASYELLWPEERIVYAPVWMEDAPKTADAALRTGLFGKLRTENRLGRYNTWNIFDKNSELARLRSAERPHDAADAAGREACVCACYDAGGLHFYAKFNDPEAWKARDGDGKGFYAEYDFQPGGENPWHWNMVQRADTVNVDQGALWDSPRKGFKVGAEYIREDAVSTDDCHVFHLYIPWILCWNELPQTGDVWRMVFVAGWAGQFGSLGGGAVHELGRGLHLAFDVPKEARAKMVKTLLRQAVKDYRSVRGKWENASFWADADLGDPAFAEAVSGPFVRACDELAVECMDAELSDARAEEIRTTRLGDLADFRLTLDGKRVDWLKARFFEDDRPVGGDARGILDR